MGDSERTDLERLADEIDREATVVALTGAGVSAPSGVPTFRGDDGVWERFDEGQFTYGRFRRDPEGFWADRLELHRAMFDEEYEPNVAHEALAALAGDGYLDAIVTQNVDGLHGDAARAVREGDGEEDGDPRSGEADEPQLHEESETDSTLLELHGNARRAACTSCDRREDAEEVFERVAGGERPPTCDCGGVLKPDVVLFGEQLPGATLQRARRLARESDVFLAIGSSLVVEPAASLPRLAAESGATLGIVTLEETPCDDVADAIRREDVTTVLPRLRELVEGG